jgi:hypothetical protein
MFVSCRVLCCQVEVPATGRSLVQKSTTDCRACVSECDQVKIKTKNLYTYCEQVGRRGKDYETNSVSNQARLHGREKRHLRLSCPSVCPHLSARLPLEGFS